MSTKSVNKLSLSDERSRISGKRLAQARREAGFSQDRLAEFLGKKDRTTISNWETGKANPSLEEVAILSVKYKKSPGWLIATDLYQKGDFPPLDQPEVMEVNEELNGIEYDVAELVEKLHLQRSDIEDLRSSLEKIQSVLEALGEMK